MNNEKVLVTGGGGLVGNYLLPLLTDNYEEVYAVEHHTQINLGIRVSLDLADLDKVRKILFDLKPNIIVNLAAFTDVDGCETNSTYADIINHRLPEQLVLYVMQMQERGLDNTYILHVSTDYIFDGNDGNYTEDSSPNPINQYGRTKLLGERSISGQKRHRNSWCIARTSTPFGVHRTKKTFPLFIVEKLMKAEKVNAIVDQITSPTYTVNLCEMLMELIQRRLSGIYHISGASRLSRYDQAIRIAKILNLDTSLVSGITSENMKWIAKRPRDSSLSIQKAIQQLHSLPVEFDTSLKSFAGELRLSSGIF